MRCKLIIFDWNGTLSTGLAINNQQITDLYPGVIELVKELDSKGYLLAIASNMSARFLQHELEYHQISKYFIRLATADRLAMKPHPAMILDLADFAGVDLAEVVMIGDSAGDMQAAANAGCAGVLVSGENIIPKLRSFLDGSA